MEEHDDWKLGDDGEPVRCPRCGKPNRAGLAYCIICGNALADGLETDPGSLRTIGEAMGGRRVRKVPKGGRSLRAWTIAAGLLLGVVVALTWVETRDQPFRLEDWLAPAPATVTPTPPPPAPTTIATRVVAPTKRPVPTPTATVPPPEPTPVWTAVPTVRRTPTRPRRVGPPRRPRAPPGQPAPDGARCRSTAGRGHRKAGVGSDLQDATRAYSRAVRPSASTVQLARRQINDGTPGTTAKYRSSFAAGRSRARGRQAPVSKRCCARGWSARYR
jgi:hypothetical protein